MGKKLKYNNQILISNPPTNKERVKELNTISKQYKNRYNSNILQDYLDKEMDLLFNFILKIHGINDGLKKIKKFKKKIIKPIYIHKEKFNRLRPDDLAKKHKVPFKADPLDSAKSSSYPSGHAAQAYYIAIELSKLYPNIRNKLISLAKMIAQSRIDRGVHFPSDIKAGKLLAIKYSNLYK